MFSNILQAINKRFIFQALVLFLSFTLLVRPFKIRTKLTFAFVAMLIPLVVLFGANSYNERAISLAAHKVEGEQREISRLSDIQIAIEGLIMPPNDYLITGNIRLREDFSSIATEVEGHLLNLSDTMSCRQCHDDTHERVKRLYGLKPKSSWPEEMVYMKEIMDTLQIIKEKGEKIFKIERPVGSKEGAILMHEIDTTVHKLIIENLAKHKNEDNQEVLLAEIDSARVWRRSRFMITGGFALSVALALLFAFFYSRFFVRPIKKLHNGADAIARGDFKARLDIKTGDELEQLANAMNEMAAQLDSLYSNLEQKVEVRTRELRESEAKFKTLLERSPSMIFINKRGRVVYANAKCEEVMKYKMEEFYSPDFDFLSLIAPESVELVRSKYDKEKKGEEVEPFEYTIVSKDGERLEVMLNSVLIDYEGEKAILGILTDITDRKFAETKLKKTYQELKQSQAASLNIMADLSREVEERKKAEAEVLHLNAELEQKVIARTAALEQAKLEVEQASRNKDEFLAAISHELKTPLNHILGFADLLKEGLAGELNAEQKEMAQDIFNAGSKQLAIVNSLIELARLQSGKVELQAKQEDPARMLGEIAARHAAKAEAAGLTFAVEVAQGLGEMPLDREVVTHLLDQLLANAFKFTPSGGKISLTARRVPRTDVAAPVWSEAGEYLELAVADNGPGIAPETLTWLFQPFVQGDGRLNRSHQGTGIGLTLVKLLAELHGGGSGVESEPGAGAKFLVWLPIGKPTQQ